MELSSLNDLLTYLEYGTNLHIGVWFFGNHGNEKLALPFERTIHSSPICDQFKSRENGLRRCFRCRNAALRKAINQRRAFGGLCINGVYEYTRPVVIDDEVVCVIFVGNIFPMQEQGANKNEDLQNYADTLEAEFDEQKCEEVSCLVESYIRMTLALSPSAKDSEREKHRFNPLIENLKTYIEANLEYNIDFSMLAKMFHYNEKYLGRLFKKEVGMSFSQYINSRRVERARELLQATDESITNIATKCGFNNVTYFNRVFKKYYGATPGEVRMSAV